MLFVAVRVGDMSRTPRIRFKIDVSAQQYAFTGCAIIYEGCNMVVVEGGPKAIKRFTHLMLNRINWDQKDAKKEGDDAEESESESDSEVEDGPRKKGGKCALVWQVRLVHI